MAFTISVADTATTSESPSLSFNLFDLHNNFAYSTIATAPSPASTGTSLTVQTGDGAKFPKPPFNATVWAAGANPLTTNSEVVRVINVASDTFTIVRNTTSELINQSRSIIVGDQIANTVSAKVLQDIETNIVGWIQPQQISKGAITLGYNEITSAASTASASDTEVTGIATSVTVPSGGRDVEIVVDGGFGYGVTATNATFKFWDGAVGGTLLRVYYCSFQGTVGVLTDLSLRVHLVAPTAGAHTYRFSIAADGVHTLQLYADGSSAKGSMTVKVV